MGFKWDDRKNVTNKAKHGLSFYEAQEAFFDKNRVILHDKKRIRPERSATFVSAK